MITDKLKPIGSTSGKETVRVAGIVKSVSTPGGGEGETDPTVPAHVKAITEEQIEAWDTMSAGEQTIPMLAADDISVDSLVGITISGAVRADAVAGIEAIGIARNSASSGETVNLVRGGVIGALTSPFPRGTLLYLGTSGNLASTPPSTGLAQRVGIATPTAAIIEIHQPIHQE